MTLQEIPVERNRANRELGFAAHERCDWVGAELAYREALRQCPDDLQVLHALGVLAVQTGAFGEAADLIARVIDVQESATLHADLGNALYGLCRFEEAIRSYDRSLALQPDFAQAHFNRANALLLLDRREDGLASFVMAAHCAPEFAPAHVGAADILRELGRPNEALARYERAIQLNADPARNLTKRAAILAELNRWEDALVGIDRALEAGAVCAESLTIRGLALAGMNRGEQALQCYEQALVKQADYLPALINLGVVLRRRNQAKEALECYGAALAIEPDSFEALSNRSAALTELHRFEEALADCDRAIVLRPERIDVHLHRAAALIGLERFHESLQSYDQALALDSSCAEALADRGGVLQRLQRRAEAVECCDRAIGLSPALARAHFNRGAALRDLGRTDEALESFRIAERLEPDNPEIKFDLGGLYLLKGQFDRGWDYYECRPRPTGRPRFSGPEWQGGPSLNGKTLLVYSDQGLGDTIQFSRYLKLAQRQGATVVVSVQHGLQKLLSGLCLDIRFIDIDHAPPLFDYQCAISSLPKAFKTTLESIPTDVPYLFAESERIDRWRTMIETRGFKIGVCWQGTSTKKGAGRAFPLQALRGIAMLPGVRLVSLQKEGADEALAKLPEGMSIEVLGNDFDRGPDFFADTAAVMQCLDLVIACDTAVTHLAGALGVPTWVPLKYVPDWRWLLDRRDSPWYPTLRLFRQTAEGSWDDVFEAIYRGLIPALADRYLQGSLIPR